MNEEEDHELIGFNWHQLLTLTTLKMQRWNVTIRYLVKNLAIEIYTQDLLKRWIHTNTHDSHKDGNQGNSWHSDVPNDQSKNC